MSSDLFKEIQEWAEQIEESRKSANEKLDRVDKKLDGIKEIIMSTQEEIAKLKIKEPPPRRNFLRLPDIGGSAWADVLSIVFGVFAGVLLGLFFFYA